jgi:hypothetical protein
MRRFVLIAAMMLASASAQAGDSRGLSTGSVTAAPSDPPAAVNTQQLRAQNDTAVVPPKPAETPRYTPPPAEAQPAQTTPPADATRSPSEAPRYTARPAPVDNAPPATASTAPSTTTPSTAQPGRRYDDKGYYDDAGYHPSRSRHAHNDRYDDRPRHHRTRLSAGRIIAALHRYGIYW